MRIVKWIVGVVAVAALVFVFVGLVIMPREIAVERDIVIAAAPASVFPHVNSLSAAAEWSPWLEIDPDVALTYEGPDAGVGNKLSWASELEDLGSGSQTITVSVENERVDSDLDFGPMGTAQATYILDAEGDGTKLTWAFTTDLGMNPMARVFGPMIKDQVAADFDKGLANLKTLVEGS